MKRNIKLLVILALVLLLGLGVIVGINNSQKLSKKPTIVTTNFPAYDFARAVAGNKIEIKMLLKPGAEMHDYEPSPSDIINIQQSELFIYTGGESDEWVEKILESLETNKTLKMTDVVELVEEEVVEGMEVQTDEEPEYDEKEGLLRLRCRLECSGWLYAMGDGADTFLDFTLKGDVNT